MEVAQQEECRKRAAEAEIAEIALAYRRISESGKEPFNNERFRQMWYPTSEITGRCYEMSEAAVDRHLKNYARMTKMRTLAQYVAYLEDLEINACN